MVIEIAITMWGLKSRATMRENEALDAFYRSRGIHMHADSHIRRRGDVYPGFPLYSDRTIKGIGETSTVNVATIPQTLSQQGVSLSISNKEHHSKYSKDDLWVVSTTPQFDATSTFFARSVFYGPSGNDIELMCLSSKDSSIARDICVNSTTVCAIKLFNAMSEFMMLDNLENSLTRTPLLPVLLNYVPPELVKASKTSVFKVPSRVPERSGCIVLTEEDGIDVEVEIQDAVERFRLNHEQAAVLRAFAQTVVRAPRWVQKPPDTPPILLVHGVYGAGKSFLIAVLIVFIDTIMNKARPLPKEQRSCRFLVSSMTNVAVDRVLIALLNLNYTKFVRVGSLKKVAKRILPFTAQSTSARAGEDIKELQAILDDDSLSASERRYVKEAMKKFQKFENRGLVEGANVVGTTCIASTFEVLDDVSFPIVILDEASPGQEVQNTKTKSFTNPAEVKLIVAFLRSLLSLNIPEASIGVISLYKSQADSIQAELNEQLKASGLKGGVQISTVDAFQGSEKDLIIVSTVRTGSIGFIDNDHRVNVALTRSKRHLFIVGNLQLLSSNRIWGPVIKGHCSVDMNGIMQGEQFAQRLRSLIPLPQQNILEPTAVIESEDDNENEAMGRHYDDYEDEDGLRHDQNEMDYDGYERSVEHFNERSVSSRIYTLYETDEDSDEESNDERNQPRDRRQMSGHNSTAPKSYIRSFAQTNVGDDDYIAVDPRSLSNLETAPDTATSSSSFEPKNSRKYVLGIFEEQNQAVPTESALQDRNILQSSGEARQMKHVSKNGFSRKARASLMVWPSMAKSLPSIINEHPQPAGYLEDQVLWEVGEEDEEKVECDERDDKMTNSRFKSIFNGNTPVENVVLSRRQSQERARSVDQFKQDWDIQEPLTYGSQRIEDLDVDWTQAESSGHSQKHIAHAASLPPRPVSEMKDRLYFDEGNGNEDEDDIGYLEISDADML
ncbi:AAA domain-domain-containing protein [Lobosporangium transversale]|uniref:AAA domain-domain-containing protein n=1 Tax=Lobosporangium transversale TaxID=64571 RepID=A0A1Y2GUB8_9FUNG|nr:AAA domain-domain-containing protein [Lobosporangium transversale]ORZ23830.1 AAA domain-domain-containing protein [Lobosporangium transversale]|eukprot:XP_021883644.1 AAA domain-domain-containing protein [Lobosporangium transversale]